MRIKQIGKIDLINQGSVNSTITFPKGCQLPYTFQSITTPDTQGKYSFKVYDVSGNEIDYHDLEFFYDEKGVTIQKVVERNENENVINAAIAFIDQLNSFNSFLHPEVLKRAKELQNAVGTYWKYNSRMAQGNWRDERDRVFVALTANEFVEWLKTHPEPAESQTFKENTFTSFRHVNPYCHDSRFCNPHSEHGIVEYDMRKIFAYIKALEKASGKYLIGYDNRQITLSGDP